MDNVVDTDVLIVGAGLAGSVLAYRLRQHGDREYRPFAYIRDNYPQYLFTLDPLLQRRDGVRHLNLADFMAEEGELLTP